MWILVPLSISIGVVHISAPHDSGHSPEFHNVPVLNGWCDSLWNDAYLFAKCCESHATDYICLHAEQYCEDVYDGNCSSSDTPGSCEDEEDWCDSICQEYEFSFCEKSNTVAIVMIVLVLVFVFMAIICISCYWCFMKKKHKIDSDSEKYCDARDDSGSGSSSSSSSSSGSHSNSNKKKMSKKQKKKLKKAKKHGLIPNLDEEPRHQATSDLPPPRPTEIPPGYIIYAPISMIPGEYGPAPVMAPADYGRPGYMFPLADYSQVRFVPGDLGIVGAPRSQPPPADVEADAPPPAPSPDDVARPVFQSVNVISVEKDSSDMNLSLSDEGNK
jgi:hypothetical protein